MTREKKDTAPSDQGGPQPPALRPGDPYQIPPEGSLGLLALGARGLDAWRAVRRAAGIDPAIRGETLDLDVFLRLHAAVEAARAD